MAIAPTHEETVAQYPCPACFAPLHAASYHPDPDERPDIIKYYGSCSKCHWLTPMSSRPAGLEAYLKTDLGRLRDFLEAVIILSVEVDVSDSMPEVREAMDQCTELMREYIRAAAKKVEVPQ